jgi:hypothetical protein
MLKLFPFWDPLRGDPRFGQIVASLAPKDAASPDEEIRNVEETRSMVCWPASNCGCASRFG